jgi:hypothetical protein
MMTTHNPFPIVDNGNIVSDSRNTPDVTLVSPAGDINQDVEDGKEGDASKKRGSGFTKTEDLLICRRGYQHLKILQIGSYKN